ncbi:hypothetical protein CJ030_MR6G023773 [Morella rubra]|uniref:Uncharacterized protein n=1 Tax=Morella rubra TaxID=262757 RepID=A0A6A1V9A0_9ROSI|nr:hypothetical protein CJ030_MR6G023773 [Morella rubra]
MIVGDNNIKSLKLVEEVMEAGNAKGSYLFCMLKLLNGPHLEFDDVNRVLRFLGLLKNNEDMMWVKQMTIQQFGRKWNDGSELEVSVDGCLGYHGNCEITKVPRLNFEWVVDYYDYDLCTYCKVNQDMAYFIYMLTCHYGLHF